MMTMREKMTSYTAMTFVYEVRRYFYASVCVIIPQATGVLVWSKATTALPMMLVRSPYMVSWNTERSSTKKLANLPALIVAPERRTTPPSVTWKNGKK